MPEMKKSSLTTIFILLVLALSLFLRLYRLPDQAGFDFDQETNFKIAQKIVEGKPVLIGQEISLGGIFVGPFYNYILAGLMVITGGHPLSVFIFQAILGVLTTWIVFKVGE